MPTHTEPPPTAGRLRAAWAAAHAPVPGAPRWGRAAALAVPLLVLPSGLWRIVTVVFPVQDDGRAHGSGDLPPWLPEEVYVVLLSVLTELLAFTAYGLIATWGEVVPRWVPGLGGRRIPTPAAVVPAAAGALLLTALSSATAVADLAGVTLRGDPLPEGYPGQVPGWSAVVFYVSYAPLLLWGPCLGALTVAYWRRRRAPTAVPTLPAPTGAAGR
ncbi:hypothetical protein [Streptomyces sporangiiformans]|uniref:Uncharacterized protein n=1 Tax=Streptomyces sporangiiformans TaxID=2315329 RepID=A0A505D6J6_9ACTN|nr:hypothetical protein [Streptomyces sporangiiformans]TPQ17862.1 hypothetical protein FGD71_033965 [Streptomyces sporangiiformans]